VIFSFFGQPFNNLTFSFYHNYKKVATEIYSIAIANEN